VLDCLARLRRTIVILPRYFVPRDGAVPEPLSATAGVASALDAFALAWESARTEWVVGFDDLGRLTAERSETEASLLAATRRDLTFQELSAGGIRVVELKALYVFGATLLEQSPHSPGVDDPVFLYGTLVGPLSVDGSPSRIEGQLTTTRGDLLAAFVSGGRWPFHRRDASTGRVEPIFSALVGADRDEALSNGVGAVIAYPAIIADPSTEALFPGNGEMVKEMLYDLLTAWWRDVAREAGGPYRRPSEIPTTDRRVEVSDYLQLAAEAFQMSPLWPSASVVELNRAVGAPPGRFSSQALRGSISPAARHASLYGEERPPDWVQTFISTRLAPGQAPRLTPAPASPSAADAAAPSTPAWTGRTPAEVLAMLDRQDRSDE
jgi:hypothetical protein